jgi:hypothetical protein
MPCQANNACASSHHCSNGIIAMLPKTESVWRKANTDDALQLFANAAIAASRVGS